MSEERKTYKTPLPGMLANLLEVSINQLLAMDDETPVRLEKLSGHLLRVDLEGLEISLFISFTADQVKVNLHADDEPDTSISGSPAALFSMAVPDQAGNWGGPGSRVNIKGDATLARDLERLFSRLEPDWEGGLSRLFGDVWGYQIASGLRAGAEQVKEAASETGEILSEYLVREKGPLVSSEELAEFADEVDRSRDAVDRLEARVRILMDNFDA